MMMTVVVIRLCVGYFSDPTDFPSRPKDEAQYDKRRDGISDHWNCIA